MTNDNDVPDWIRSIIDALGQAQAFNRANSYILMEVARDLARVTADPDKYLASMYERVSARADQGEIEKEAHPVNAEFRLAIETFFVNARKNLRKRDTT